MTFALTSAEFFGMEIDEAITSKFYQYMHIKITAANTDTAFDLGDVGGTLWGVLDGSAGGLAALNAFKVLITNMESFDCLLGKGIVTYQQVLTGAAGLQYVETLDSTSGLPKLAYVSGSAPTAYDLILKVILKDDTNPIKLKITGP
jgi:hypothetical protein